MERNQHPGVRSQKLRLRSQKRKIKRERRPLEPASQKGSPHGTVGTTGNENGA